MGTFPPGLVWDPRCLGVSEVHTEHRYGASLSPELVSQQHAAQTCFLSSTFKEKLK